MYMDYFTKSLYVVGLFFTIYVLIAKRDFFLKYKRELLFFMLAFLIYTQYRRYFARFFVSPFVINLENLPIHFCRMSGIMTLLYLLTKNKYIKGFVFFQSGLAFLSVLFPGGLLLQLTQDWRNLTFLSDHFLIALMPVVLIFIDGYQVNKKDLKVSLVYSLVLPILVLPIALASGYNAYYVLDGVFIRDVVGDNQLVIIIVMELLLVLYNVVMYYIGKWLYTVSEKRKSQEKSQVLKPIYPWVLFSAYIVVGTIIGIFYIRPVPDYLIEIPDAYVAQPTMVVSNELVIYQGMNDHEIMYFIESLNGKEVHVIQPSGTVLDSDIINGYDGIVFSLDNTFENENLIIVIGEGSSIETHVLSVNTIEKFQSDYQNKIKYND